MDRKITSALLFPQVGDNILDFKVVKLEADLVVLERTFKGQRLRFATHPNTLVFVEKVSPPE